MSDVERHEEVEENSGSDGEDLTFNEPDFSLGEEDDVLFEENVTENIELHPSTDLLSLVDRTDSDTSKYDSLDELRSVNSDSEEEVIRYPEFNGEKNMMDPVLEIGLKFRSKEELMADENQHGDGFGLGASSRAHVGEHVAYSQPASSLSGIMQQEIPASFSQPYGSTGQRTRKNFTPRRRLKSTGNLVSTPTLKDAWNNMMNK
ncbi:Uncharacterized protein Adt_30582 [Abeliophyllum distichum]|uniref:Uncharacterized protein n=1 Tax=Abeliophyllum distichum TaxID=126358 RepID=A0ABD1RBN1_9LAMI